MPGLTGADRYAGHSLIEVLAALALTSVGVIGFLHAQHLRQATETDLLSHTRAAMLARDITRKIAANPEALGAYRAAYDTLPALTANCRQSSCSRHELAAFHVAHWKCRLGRWTQRAVCRDVLKTRGLLPQGDGRMEPSGAGIRGEIRWVGADHEPRLLEMGHALLRR